MNQSIDTTGTCIDFDGADNITFDCNYYNITGDLSGSDNGIYLPDTGDGSNYNTVKNCNVSKFYIAITLESSNYSTIQNLILYNNSNGMWTEGGPSNNIISNIWADNEYGIYIYS
ncbi:unnamed protein product, partial [marine sediment metagenome]